MQFVLHKLRKLGTKYPLVSKIQLEVNFIAKALALSDED